MSTYKVLAVNDDKDFCQCCGRQGLTRVVWIENEETGDIQHFGTTCAASPAKAFGLDGEIKSAIKQFTDRQKFLHQITWHEYRRQGGKMVPHPTKAHTWVPQDAALRDRIFAQQSAVH